jgi:hypothetical protein
MNAAYIVKILIQVCLCMVLIIYLMCYKHKKTDDLDVFQYQITRQVTSEEAEKFAVQAYSLAIVSLNIHRSYPQKMLSETIDVLAYEFTRTCRDTIMKKCLSALINNDGVAFDGTHLHTTTILPNTALKEYLNKQCSRIYCSRLYNSAVSRGNRSASSTLNSPF